MSINVVATTDYVEEKLSNINTKIDDHNRQYGQNYFILTDIVNGHEYIVEMQDGNLVSYCKCLGIRVEKLPDKTTGIFDPTGMVVVADFQDGTTIEITDYTVSINDGVTTITYNQLGVLYTTSFTTEMVLAEQALIDFEYIANDDGTYTLTGWKQTLNGAPSTEMVIPDYDVIIVEVV